MIAVAAFTLRFALAIVLAVAAVAKARSFGAFVRTVDAIVPWQRPARAAAAAVIAVEAALSVLLAAGVWVNAVSLGTLALFLGFAAVSLWAARHEVHVRCNCFGQSERELGKDSLVTSLLLAGATVAYWTLLRRRTSRSRSASCLSPWCSGPSWCSVRGGPSSRESWSESSVNGRCSKAISRK